VHDSMFVRCTVHNETIEVEVGPMKPAPPASHVCGKCLAELHVDRSGNGSHAVERTRSVAEEKYPMLSPRVAAAWERKQAQMRAEGRLPAYDERERLEENDYVIRPEVIRRDHAPKGRRYGRTVVVRGGNVEDDGFVEVLR